MVKRPGAFSKVQMPNLVLGVGVFSLLPSLAIPEQFQATSRLAIPHSLLE